MKEQNNTEERFKEYIQNLEANSKGIKRIVIRDIIDEYPEYEEAIRYLKDVVQYGGVSGIISGLVYYTDTNKFYDENEEEIEGILEDFRDNFGYKNRAEAISNLNGSAESITQEKNLLAWMAYEEIARILLEEIEEEFNKNA